MVSLQKLSTLIQLWYGCDTNENLKNSRCCMKAKEAKDSKPMKDWNFHSTLHFCGSATNKCKLLLQFVVKNKSTCRPTLGVICVNNLWEAGEFLGVFNYKMVSKDKWMKTTEFKKDLYFWEKLMATNLSCTHQLYFFYPRI